MQARQIVQKANVLVERAWEYGERARLHKREEARHRRASRKCRRKQADLEAECERLGIELTYTNGEGKLSHGQASLRPIDPY